MTTKKFHSNRSDRFLGKSEENLIDNNLDDFGFGSPKCIKCKDKLKLLDNVPYFSLYSSVNKCRLVPRFCGDTVITLFLRSTNNLVRLRAEPESLWKAYNWSIQSTKMILVIISADFFYIFLLLLQERQRYVRLLSASHFYSYVKCEYTTRSCFRSKANDNYS